MFKLEYEGKTMMPVLLPVGPTGIVEGGHIHLAPYMLREAGWVPKAELDEAIAGSAFDCAAPDSPQGRL